MKRHVERNLDRCPHCGSQLGVYREQVIHHVYHFDFLGQCVREVYDRMKEIRASKTVRCFACNGAFRWKPPSQPTA